MKLTNAMKSYAESKLGVKKGSADKDYTKAVSAAVASGALSGVDYMNLVNDKAPAPTPEPKTDKGGKPKKKKAAPAGMTPEEVTKLVKAATKKAVKAAGLGRTDALPTPQEVYGNGAVTQARVKSAAEMYSTTKTAALYPTKSRVSGEEHPLAGHQATYMGRPLDRPSDLDKAVSGAWFKWCIKSSNGGSNNGIPQNLQVTPHDQDLVMHAMKHMAWTGHVKGAQGGEYKVNRKKLTEFETKALLDDTVSGGIEITPVVFDDAIVMIPVLFGELFPFVNVTNIPKGRRVKSGSMQNPTFSSGTAEGTAIQPFNTSAFVGAFDTPIHVAVGAMETGLDFEEDTAVDLGSAIVEKYGDKALEWLDRVIAVGNGYNEPLGILNTTGLVAIGTDNGVAGPPTVSDYEGLYFGLAKQWRNEAGAMTAYIGNDTSYRRAMGIQVGPGDERRVFGMEHDAYQMLKRPFKVQNDIPNSKLCFVNLKRYRMYRRLGLTVRMETAGRQLALSNTKLLVLRMRYGGQMENANAVAINNDAQS